MAPASPATIVVVEPTPAAQELVDQALRAHGHRVLVTADPAEALRLAERVRIDLVIGDAELCRDRPALVEELRSLQPDTAILRIAEPGEVHRSEISNGKALGRPFSLDELERAVTKTLAARD
jgi:DNA-binding response OmpR family regulator